jgi:hypothetical protein
MKLHRPFVQLPLAFDAQALRAEIEAFGEELWKPHPQGFAGNSMLPLVAVNGDPDDESFAGPMRPTPALQRSSYLGQVLASLGATIGRSRLMRLSGHAEVARHADQHYYWAERARVHVPVLTQPTVRFECGGVAVNMASGECWIFDTWRQHRVLNDATEQRVHLVVDTVGGGRFWELVGRGRLYPDPQKGSWQPELIAPLAGDHFFPCENVNVPVVMSPWELNSHLGLLFSHALPHPGLGAVRELSARFARQWQGLWFEYGEDGRGREHYRAALSRFVDDVKGPSQGLLLNNELRWFEAMTMMIAQYAVGPESTRATSPGPAAEMTVTG